MRNKLMGAIAFLAVVVAVVSFVGPAEAASSLVQLFLVRDPPSTAISDATVRIDVGNYESNELALAVASSTTGLFTVDEDGDVVVAGRLDLGAHGNGVGLNLPTKAGACAAVTGTAEGDICWDSTNNALYIYDGAAYGTLGTSSYPLTGQALPTYDPAGTNDAQASLYFDVAGFEANEKVLATSTGASLDEDGDLVVVGLTMSGQTLPTFDPAGTNDNQAAIYFDVAGYEANEKVLATSTGASLDEDGDMVVTSLAIGSGTAVTASIKASAAINFAEIANGACIANTLTVTGAAANDPVACSYPAALEDGLVGTCWVSAADTVSLRLCNVTGAPINPADGTFAARVIR